MSDPGNGRPRSFTPLSHEKFGQITEIANGGWNVEAGEFSTITSYSKLKAAFLKLLTLPEWRKRFPRQRRPEFLVLDAIAAGFESGQITYENIYSIVFKDRRDWKRLAADLSYRPNGGRWMNERHYYSLSMFSSGVPNYVELAENLVDDLRDAAHFGKK